MEEKEYPMCLRCMYWAESAKFGNGQCFVFQYAPVDTKFNDVCNGFTKRHETISKEEQKKEETS